MLTRLFLGYLITEVAVLAVLVSTIGFARTALVLLATFVIGIAVSVTQTRRQLARLQSNGWRDTGTDAGLTALGSVLVMVPGLVTTVAGLLLLLPISRAVLRPALASAAVAGLGRRMPLVTVATVGAHRYASRERTDFIDGEVIDDTYTEPPAVPGHEVHISPTP
ncbi:MAG TPA: FxsA family protein [Mycobacterium sp.]|nr:FxsA family protein [Mycobacterium sp.]